MLLISPLNDVQRMVWMHLFHANASEPNTKGMLPNELVRDIGRVKNAFEKAHSQAENLRLMRRSDLRDGAVAKLEKVVRHFIQVAKMRTERLGWPEWTAKKYRPQTNGVVQRIRTQSQWIEAAKHLIAVEKRNIDKGRPPMSNPSYKDVQKALKEAEKHHGHFQEMDRKAQDEEKHLRRLRDQAEVLFRQASGYFRYKYAGWKASARRRLMRSFGFIFKSNPKRKKREPPEQPPEKNLTEVINYLTQNKKAVTPENKKAILALYQAAEANEPEDQPPQPLQSTEPEPQKDPNPKTEPS